MTLFQLKVDPKYYTGKLWVAKNTTTGTVKMGPFSGVSELFLPEGPFFFLCSHGANIPFLVTAKGGIVADPSCGLLVRNNAMEFQTQVIQLESGDYSGTYLISGVDDRKLSGSRNITAVKGIRSNNDYDAGYIVELAPSNSFRFNLDCNGLVSLNLHHKAAAWSNGSTIHFNTVHVTVEPMNYTMDWSIAGAAATSSPGKRSVVLVPGVKGYILQLYRGGLSARFNILANGDPEFNDMMIPDGNNTWRFRIARM